MSSARLESGKRVRYSRRVYYSPSAGCTVERLSIPDAHGQEHWAELARPTTKEERRDAIERIVAHAAAHDPGRVEVREEECL